MAETADILGRWAEYFEEILNPSNIHLEDHIHPSDEFEETVELNVEEMGIKLAIKELKKKIKTPRPDGLPA
jgi:hypothetical protein